MQRGEENRVNNENNETKTKGTRENRHGGKSKNQGWQEKQIHREKKICESERCKWKVRKTKSRGQAREERVTC